MLSSCASRPGDYEQLQARPIYKICDYTCMYVLAALEAGRSATSAECRKTCIGRVQPVRGSESRKGPPRNLCSPMIASKDLTGGEDAGWPALLTFCGMMTAPTSETAWTTA